MQLPKLTTLAFAGLFLAWFVLFRPVSLGGPAAYEVVTGTSMEPRLHTGDLVITQAQSAYAIGEVVVFRVPADEPGGGSLIVHRLIGGDGASGYITRGDNKPAPDPWHPKSSDVIGRAWIELPGSGKALLVLRQPLVLAVLLSGLAGFWVLTSRSTSPGAPVDDGRRSRLPWKRRRPSAASEEATPR